MDEKAVREVIAQARAMMAEYNMGPYRNERDAPAAAYDRCFWAGVRLGMDIVVGKLCEHLPRPLGSYPLTEPDLMEDITS